MENLLDGAEASAHVNTAIEMTMQYLPQLVLAVVVLIIGLWVIRRMVALIAKGMERSGAEPTLARFLESLASITLKALLFISVASMVGIATTSFIAVLGAAGLAIGLALQGSLANFAGGVLVLLFRPYKVGDFITAQGVSGTVADIQIFNTILKTPDNVRIIIPNGSISNGTVSNFSAEPTRRVDFVFGIGYDDDIAKAKQVIDAVLSDEERVFKEPAPLVVVSNLGESSVDITVRVWCVAADYWALKFHLTEAVKLAFDRNDITIPFPQRDVHVHQDELLPARPRALSN